MGAQINRDRLTATGANGTGSWWRVVAGVAPSGLFPLLLLPVLELLFHHGLFAFGGASVGRTLTRGRPLARRGSRARATRIGSLPAAAAARRRLHRQRDPLAGQVYRENCDHHSLLNLHHFRGILHEAIRELAD